MTERKADDSRPGAGSGGRSDPPDPSRGLEMSPQEFRRLGYRAIDMIADNLERIQNRREPARRAVPAAVRERLLTQPMPAGGTGRDRLLDYFEENILPYPLGHNSARFFAWVNSPAAPISLLGELLASAMNSSGAGGDQAGFYLEHAVLNWLKEIVGFPPDSGAILVSGGSAATLVGLAVMRHVKATSGDQRGKGLLGESVPMVVYTSSEGHSCIHKAVELLGIGHANLRKIRVDDEFRMDVEELERQIASDRAAGLNPVCVAATAGTVNTGAVDPLDRIADVCSREGLWFHVDGAYGAAAVLTDPNRELFAGLDRADSLGMDPHKWMYIPVECGAAIVRDRQAMRDTFSMVPSYLQDDRELPWFSEYGPQQTRAFRSLKLWMAMMEIGVDGYRTLIGRDIALARALRRKLAERSHFQLMSAGPLSITCFRYVPGGDRPEASRPPAKRKVPDGDGQDASAQQENGSNGAGIEERLDALNRSILEAVQRSGDVYLTSTEIRGRFVLRVCIVNFRTSEADLDCLLNAVQAAARSHGEG